MRPIAEPRRARMRDLDRKVSSATDHRSRRLSLTETALSFRVQCKPTVIRCKVTDGAAMPPSECPRLRGTTVSFSTIGSIESSIDCRRGKSGQSPSPSCRIPAAGPGATRPTDRRVARSVGLGLVDASRLRRSIAIGRDDLAPRLGPQGHPDLHADIVLDELDRAVGHEGVDPAGVEAVGLAIFGQAGGGGGPTVSPGIGLSLIHI